MRLIFIRTLDFLNKQLASGFRPQSYLYFLGFWGSKLLKGCFVVSPSNLCLWGMQQLSGFK